MPWQRHSQPTPTPQFIFRTKNLKRQACLPYELNDSNRAKGWWIPKETFKLNYGDVHWWWVISATIQWSNLYLFECWSQTPVIVHSTSQHSTAWWAHRKVCEERKGEVSKLSAEPSASRRQTKCMTQRLESSFAYPGQTARTWKSGGHVSDKLPEGTSDRRTIAWVGEIFRVVKLAMDRMSVTSVMQSFSLCSVNCSCNHKTAVFC